MRTRVPGVWTLLCAALLFAGAARAAEPLKMDVAGPVVAQVKQSMAARAEAIARHKDFGHIGEGRDGLLAVRSLEGLDLRTKKSIEDLLAAENADRRALYREIARANGLSDENAGRVLDEAGRAQRTSAKPGHYVQDPRSGAWTLKRDLKE